MEHNTLGPWIPGAIFMVSPKKAEQEYGGKGNGSQPKVPMMTSILLLFFGTDMHIQTHTCAVHYVMCFARRVGLCGTNTCCARRTVTEETVYKIVTLKKGESRINCKVQVPVTNTL